MSRNLAGSIYVLTVLPIWATAAILFAVTMAVILIGRDLTEGLPYQVAYSAMIGDAGLIIGILIATTILQRGGAQVPEWLQSGSNHFIVLALCSGFGVLVFVLTRGLRSGQLMDMYHDIVVVPIFLYLAITLIPIIWKNGMRVEIGATLGMVVLWAVLVVFDVKYQRMDQRSWLRSHGVTLQK